MYRGDGEGQCGVRLDRLARCGGAEKYGSLETGGPDDAEHGCGIRVQYLTSGFQILFPASGG